jgi:uncharacterized protein (TIGR00369 family)
LQHLCRVGFATAATQSTGRELGRDCLSDDIPPSFAPLEIAMGFLESNGPLYLRWSDDKVTLGFRVERRHCNPGSVCHGGMLATFADMLLPIASRLQSRTEMGFLPTINLTCDFLAPARLGAWVEGRAEAVAVTRNLLYAQGAVTADGVPCLRANGIFKITNPDSTKRGDFSRDAVLGYTHAPA